MLQQIASCFPYLSLVVVGMLTEPVEFTARPLQTATVFPSPASFKEVRNRRLNANGENSERRLFEAEENGHRFVYEYGGKSTAEQILDVDKVESVRGMACRKIQDRKHRASTTMWLQWDDDATPGISALARKPLKPGDVVTGGASWNCGKRKGLGFLRQVVSVRRHATRENTTTEITAREISPLQIFKDLHVDFTWMRPANQSDQSGGRLLMGEDASIVSTVGAAAANENNWGWEAEIADFNFNYDQSTFVRTQRANKPFDMGPFVCDNCYAYLKPMMRFKLITDNFYPKEVSLRFDVDASVHIDMKVHPDVQDKVSEVINKWEQVVEEKGDDFLQDLLLKGISGLSTEAKHVAVPLFHGLSELLSLEAYPLTEMFSKVGGVTKFLQEARLTASLSLLPNETFIEIGWKQEKGVYTDYGFNLRHSFQLAGFDSAAEMFVGLKLCSGVAFAAGNSKDPLTSLSLCPEALLNKNALGNLLAPAALLMTNDTPDKKLCITFVSFETNLDLDQWWQGVPGLSVDDALDDPFAEACFQGECVTTNRHTKFKDEVATWNEEHCLNVKQAHLFGDEAGPINFVVKEEDLGGYNEQYTQQQAWRLPESCKEQCEMTFADMKIPPSKQDAGDKAKLVVKIQFKELDDMSDCAPNCNSAPPGESEFRPQCDSGSFWQSIGFGEASPQPVIASTLALGGRWSGFTYPNFFGHGSGDEVYAPVEAPTKKLRDAEITCVVEELSILSSAYGSDCNLIIISLMFAMSASLIL